MPLNNIQDNTYNRLGQYNVKHDNTMQRLSNNMKPSNGSIPENSRTAMRRSAMDTYSHSTEQDANEPVNVSDYKIAKALNAYQVQMQNRF